MNEHLCLLKGFSFLHVSLKEYFIYYIACLVKYQQLPDWVSCYTELALFCLELFLFWSVHSISFWIVHLYAYVGIIMHPKQDIWDLMWTTSWN